MKESDIMHENGRLWVGRSTGGYTVYVSGLTHSVADSTYARTDDGLSIAKARADYLARQDVDHIYAALSALP